MYTLFAKASRPLAAERATRSLLIQRHTSNRFTFTRSDISYGGLAYEMNNAAFEADGITCAEGMEVDTGFPGQEGLCVPLGLSLSADGSRLYMVNRRATLPSDSSQVRIPETLARYDRDRGHDAASMRTAGHYVSGDPPVPRSPVPAPP